VSLAEREGKGEGEEFIVIRGSARDTGLLHPAGEEETAQGGIGADPQKVGGVAGGVGHGGLLSFGVGFSTAIIPHPAVSVKWGFVNTKRGRRSDPFYVK
jgi:hypothetical protein